MGNRIDNLDLIIATRDLIKEGLDANSVNITVFDSVYPNKLLPDEFILVKSLSQSDDGNIDVSGTVEVCIYVKNLNKDDDNTQPNLSRINMITKIIYPIIFDAQKNGVFFNDIQATLVKDSDIGYFYNSLIIETMSINLKFYNE